MRIVFVVYAISWIVLLCGAVGRMFCPELAAWLFLIASLFLAVCQFLLRVRGGNYVLKRLVLQQQISGILFVVAGVLMFTHTRNEWIIAMLIGALFQLYTAFRIPQEVDRQGLNK